MLDVIASGGIFAGWTIGRFFHHFLSRCPRKRLASLISSVNQASVRCNTLLCHLNGTCLWITLNIILPSCDSAPYRVCKQFTALAPSWVCKQFTAFNEIRQEFRVDGFKVTLGSSTSGENMELTERELMQESFYLVIKISNIWPSVCVSQRSVLS